MYMVTQPSRHLDKTTRAVKPFIYTAIYIFSKQLLQITVQIRCLSIILKSVHKILCVKAIKLYLLYIWLTCRYNAVNFGYTGLTITFNRRNGSPALPTHSPPLPLNNTHQ